MKKEQKLNRLDIMALVLGAIIGWGSFTLPGSKFLPQSGVINTMIGFVLGGVLVSSVVIGYRTLMQNNHEDGGEFSYTLRNLGQGHGFVVGWALVLCYLSLVPLNATAAALILKEIIPGGLRFGYLYEVAGYPVYLSEVGIAALVVVIFAYINIRGVSVSAKVQQVLSGLLFFNILFVLLYMLFHVDLSVFYQNYFVGYRFDFRQISGVVAITPFLFVGFDVVPQVTTDLGFPAEKTIRISIITVFIGAFIYNALNWVAGLAFSAEEAAAQNWAVGAAVLRYMGTGGFILLTLALFGAVFGGINGFMISSSKLLGAMAAYRMIPAKYQEKNQVGVYRNAILFVSALSILAPFLGREIIIYVVDMCSLMAAIVYGYICFIGIRYSTGKYRIMSVLGLLASILFVGLLVWPGSPSCLQTSSIIITVLWVVLGIFYYFTVAAKKKA